MTFSVIFVYFVVRMVVVQSIRKHIRLVLDNPVYATRDSRDWSKKLSVMRDFMQLNLH